MEGDEWLTRLSFYACTWVNVLGGVKKGLSIVNSSCDDDMMHGLHVFPVPDLSAEMPRKRNQEVNYEFEL